MNSSEYEDEKGDTVKLSEVDIYEVMAISSFRNLMQNETGPKKTCPLDITDFLRNDFTQYLNNDYDEDNPDKYGSKQANESLAAREKVEADRALHKEKHEAEMKKLAATTANVMTTTGGTTNTANSSGGGSVRWWQFKWRYIQWRWNYFSC